MPTTRSTRPTQSAFALTLGAFLLLGCALLPLPADAGVVATGTFQSKESGLVAKGGFEIREAEGAYTLVVSADFKVSDGPDLFFVFHPLAAAKVNGGNAKTQALRIDPKLRSLSGTQTYPLPAGFDPAKYPTLLIHCWQYNHLYAAGTIALTAPSSVRPGPGGAAKAAKPVASTGRGIGFTRGAEGFDARGRSRSVAGRADDAGR